MKILVTFAVRAEFAPWQRRRNFLRLGGGLPVFEAAIGGAKIRAVLTGMGPEHAQESARRAFAAYGPDICISTGLAGTLRDGYRAGEIVAARLVSEVGEPVAVASHRELLATAVDCGARRIERMATSKSLVMQSEKKRELGKQAEAVEMESYAILAEAARCGIPAVAVRAVSDTVDFDVPYDFDRVRDERGQIRILGVVSQALLRPSGLPGLLKLAGDSRTAAKRLAHFLDAFVGTMADRLIPIEQDTVAVL